MSCRSSAGRRGAGRAASGSCAPGAVILVPGDSPIGYRLPLDSQPWVRKERLSVHPFPDPTQAFPPLPIAGRDPRAGGRQPQREPGGRAGLHLHAADRDARRLPRTDVTAVEATAEALASPVVVEGYEPPSDPRLTNFRVTPDPGVIEVNIQPAASWDELVERTTHLYEAAHLSRLCTEKFMLDGRHTGTGGGNHFVARRRHAGSTRPSCAGPTCCAA
jgi:uncharacterized protein (DUF2126 family)